MAADSDRGPRNSLVQLQADLEAERRRATQPGADWLQQDPEVPGVLPPHLDLTAFKDLPDPSVVSLLYFTHDHPVRTFCRNVYTDKRFGNVVLGLILANCALMFFQFSWPDCDGGENGQARELHPCGLDPVDFWLDLFFTIAFTVEMTIKIIALGFVSHRKSYLRSAWNVLDFIIVLSSWTDHVPVPFTASQVRVLRLLRVLRPLRTMSRVAGLRTLMAALFGAMPEILDNIVLLAFLNLIFAILGVQLFEGRLHNRCLLQEPGQEPRLLPGMVEHCGGTRSCHDPDLLDKSMNPTYVYCGSDRDLPSGGGDELSRDPLHFDHLGSALLLIFKVFTGDDWPDDMNRLQNSMGHATFVYFFFCYTVGGLFATNLFLAVLISAYYTNKGLVEETRAKAVEAWHQQVPKKELNGGTPCRNGRCAAGSPPRLLPPPEQNVKIASVGSHTEEDGKPAPAADDGAPPEQKDQPGSMLNVPSSLENDETGAAHDSGAEQSVRELKLSGRGLNASASSHEPPSPREELPRKESGLSMAHSHTTGHRRAHRRPTFAAASIPVPEDDDDLDRTSQPSRRESFTKAVPPVPVWESSKAAAQRTRFQEMQSVLGPAVMNRRTQNFIMFVTVVNVVVLACDYHNIDDQFLSVLNQCNLACTIIFAVEIGLKTLGIGPRKTYLDIQNGSGWNCFDLVLVLISVPDLAQGGSSSFTAFRAFRLMKLVRRFPQVQTLLRALIGCMSEGGYVSLLLLLLIFIFSIMGMLFFERRFQEPSWGNTTEYDRENFNSLWEASLTCLIIITGDAWGAVMKEGMIHTSWAAFLYFFMLYLMGNFVLVNVFVAVILDKLDWATHEQERSHVVLRITGSRGCDGVYEPTTDGDHDLLWKRMGGDEENARYLYSTTDEQPFWVVWSSMDDREPEQAYLVSDLHDAKMPHEVGAWRHGVEDREWDECIVVSEVEEDEMLRPFNESDAETRFNAILLASSGGASARLRVDVIAGGELGERTGVQLQEDGTAVDIVPEGPAATAGVRCRWQLVSVDATAVADLQEAVTAFAAAASGSTVSLYFRSPREDSVSGQLDWTRDDAQAVGWWDKFFEVRHVELYGTSFLPSDTREQLSRVVFSAFFDLFILLVILANVVFLALEHPGVSPGLERALYVSNWVFSAIFLIEMVLKISVMGVYHEVDEPDRKDPTVCGAYFRDPWNCLDCFVVVTAVAGLIPAASDLKAFRSLRTLRLVIRSQQLRIVITALVKTVPALGVGLAVCGFIFFVFAILGLSLFKGKFYTCFGGDLQAYAAAHNITGRVDVIAREEECLLFNGTWGRALNEADHFDNIGNSLLTLFVVAIGEGWSQILFMGIDAAGVGKSPIVNNQPVMALFFVLFHVVGNFFCLNLVIGILISEFTNQRRELDGTQGTHLSEKQQSYIHSEKAVLHKIMFKDLPVPPTKDWGNIRERCFATVQNKTFDQIITFVIIVNMLVFSTVHYQQTAFWDKLLYWGSLVCSIIFVAEAAVKILGLGPSYYFGENWNRFDFAIVVVSVLDIFNVPGGISAVKVLRVGRLFRLVGKAKGLQKLFNTMFQGDNLYYFGNIGFFCIAIIFMFAVAGVSLFGSIERSEGVDHNLNFENVGFAMITLFTISTTEAWLNVRNGLIDGRTISGHVFALAWIVIGSIVLLNLFAAVVVELFDKQEAQERCRREIDAINEFRCRWRQRFGTDGPDDEVTLQAFIQGLAPARSLPPDAPVPPESECLLPTRLRRLPRPRVEGAVPDEVNLPLKPNPMQLLAFLAALGLPLRKSSRDGVAGEAVVRYRDAAFCFAARAFGLLPDDVDQIHESGLSRGPRIPANSFLASHWMAAHILQTKLRARIRKRAGRHPHTAPDADAAAAPPPPAQPAAPAAAAAGS
eukprot:TRINITY_DN2162_c0_g1_i2.p1 TRINITY_DN2162_c0_g1~~TRINITY_DN2162_c0_g1_i2.p1  ORF type:complete len:1885 (+),score=667.97 TRINITY_DN2162_c0_g1_i2:215-5869(+)